MKRLMFVLALLIGFIAFSVTAHAVSLEKFIVDASTPVRDLGSLKTDLSDFHHWTVSTQVKVAVLDYHGMAIGFDVKPAFDLNSSALNMNAGVFIRPFQYVEAYFSHANDINLGGGSQSNEINTVGVRLRFVDR